MKFFLGTHKPRWLAHLNVPLFIARQRFTGRRGFPYAQCSWALDSGAFSEIAAHGRWRIGPQEFVRQVKRISAQCGRLEFIAPQDWMCEPEMVKKTGLSVQEHQRLTLDNFLQLRAISPLMPFIPVLQGWDVQDYYRHCDMYRAAGIDLAAEPRVGLGSVCRRQAMKEIGVLVRDLAEDGLRLHGFGVKKEGVAMFGRFLHSADSLAWSFRARMASIRLPGCPHRNCANCSKYALIWRQEVLDACICEEEIAA